MIYFRFILLWFLVLYVGHSESDLPQWDKRDDNVCDGLPNPSFLPHPINCKYFLYCVNGHVNTVECPQGLAFNPAKPPCDAEANVNCYDGTTGPPTTTTPIPITTTTRRPTTTRPTTTSTTTTIRPTTTSTTTPKTTMSTTTTTTTIRPTTTTTTTTTTTSTTTTTTPRPPTPQTTTPMLTTTTSTTSTTTPSPTTTSTSTSTSTTSKPTTITPLTTTTTIAPTTTTTTLLTTIPETTTPSTTISSSFATTIPSTIPTTATPFLPTDVTTTPEPTTRWPIEPDVICPLRDDPNKIIFVSSNDDCSKYYLCYHNTPFPMTCANGLHWNFKISKCDLPENAECTITQMPNDFPKCGRKQIELFPHPENCEWFLYCYHGHMTIQQCPFYFHWDVDSKSCQMKHIANCYRKEEQKVNIISSRFRI